jgi:hypothetical protein
VRYDCGGTADEQRRWLAQWRRAAVELDRVRTRELAALTPAEALAASEALLALVVPGVVGEHRRTMSGLVAQQRLFGRARA